MGGGSGGDYVAAQAPRAYGRARAQHTRAAHTCAHARTNERARDAQSARARARKQRRAQRAQILIAHALGRARARAPGSGKRRGEGHEREPAVRRHCHPRRPVRRRHRRPAPGPRHRARRRPVRRPQLAAAPAPPPTAALRERPARGRAVVARSAAERLRGRCGSAPLPLRRVQLNRSAVESTTAGGRGGGGGPGEEMGVGDVRREQAVGKQNRGGQVVVVFEGDEITHLPAPIGLGVVDRPGRWCRETPNA